MKSRLTIFSDDMEREFDHGSYEVVRLDEIERKVIIEMSLVLVQKDALDFKKELEDLIKRYAI
jgi:hypothetical protein